jgi:hypothetical protein
MSCDRRLVLKGLAATGFAMASLRLAHAAPGVAGTAGAAALPGATAAVTPLVTGSALDAEFLAGVRAAAQAQGLVDKAPIRVQALDAAVFTRLDALLQSGQPATLVGLADTASATLVLDLVRSAGGRVLSTAQHRLPDDAQAAQTAQALGDGLVRGVPSIAPAAAQPAGTAFVSFCCVI